MTKRRDLFDPTDPDRFQPEQRVTEVAAILAAGVIRMRSRRRLDPASTQRFRPKSRQICLELARETSPDGQCG